MARIIHVEDEEEWIEVTARALADHRVDPARNYDEALSLIRNNTPYDLALVDLDLGSGNDDLGNEILDLLKLEYPSTRRIVVTAKLPSGGLRANIFEKYGVEEIIVKGKTTLPDLRKVVAEALMRPADEIPQDVRIRKSELTQRYRDWWSHTDNNLRSRILEAQEYARNAGRLHGQSGRRAENELDRWLKLQGVFRQECTTLEERLASIRQMEDAVTAMERLERVRADISESIARLENEQGKRG